MRIGFDASTIQLTKGGTTVYFNNLLTALRNVAPENDYILFSTGNPTSRNKLLLRQIDTLYRLYWQQYKLPKLAKENNLDVLHSPAPFAPLRAEVPRVVTFHDIYILKDPSSFHIWQSQISNYIYPKIINSGCKIIADTNFTKKEMTSRFNIEDDQISVIHLGIDNRFRVNSNKDELELVKAKYKLPSEFILYVGAIEPRKNMQRLVDAMSIVHNTENIPLVIVSFGGWKNKQIYQAIKKLGNNIMLLTNINDIELPAFYNLATLFVFPSLYEGFGLPVLEAMACGCPVAISNCGAHMEIGDDSALFFNPTNVEDIADKILTIINSSELTQLLISKGIYNSQKYSWEKCAIKTLDVYKSLI